MYRYWPFRSRTRTSDNCQHAPRGRLEEEVVDTLHVRGVATGREGVSTPAEGVGTRPGDARASASRAGAPCAPSTSAARELSIAVESATLEDEDESVRFAAVIALGQLGAHAAAAVPALTKRLEDERAGGYWDVRSAAATALDKIRDHRDHQRPVSSRLFQR